MKFSKLVYRNLFRNKLRAGELNDREIEIEVADSGAPMQFEVPGQPGASVGMINIGDMFSADEASSETE